MTKEEYQEFLRELVRLFPFDFREDAVTLAKRWMPVKDQSFDACIRHIRRRKKSNDTMPASQRIAPNPQETREDASKYNGIGSLMWKAMKRIKDERT